MKKLLSFVFLVIILFPTFGVSQDKRSKFKPNFELYNKTKNNIYVELEPIVFGAPHAPLITSHEGERKAVLKRVTITPYKKKIFSNNKHPQGILKTQVDMSDRIGLRVYSSNRFSHDKSANETYTIQVKKSGKKLVLSYDQTGLSLKNKKLTKFFTITKETDLTWAPKRGVFQLRSSK